MATGKRYYWIKIKESFVDSDEFDYLMEQRNGASYVVLYELLCLRTANTQGRLTRQIGDVFVPYDIDKIQRDCKWFDVDTIRVALELFKGLKLIYEDHDGTLVLAEHKSMVGSETDYAAQKSQQRLRQKNTPQIASSREPSSGADTPVDNGVDNVHTDIRDKILDNNSSRSSCCSTALADCIRRNWGREPTIAELAELLELVWWFDRNYGEGAEELVRMAIESAIDHGAPHLAYVKGVCHKLHDRGIMTYDEYLDYKIKEDLRI